MKAERTASRRWYWPAAAAMNLRRFGPLARIPIRWRDPSLAGLPKSTIPRSTAPAVARVDYRRTSHTRFVAASKGGVPRDEEVGSKKIPGQWPGKVDHKRGNALALATLSALSRLLLTTVLATLSGFLILLSRLRLSAAALLPALTSLLTTLAALLTTLVLLARLLFIRILISPSSFLPE